jgi:Ca2+-binding RTX toxin-like protein
VTTRYPAHPGLGAIAWAPDGNSFAYTAEGSRATVKAIGNGVWRVRLGQTKLAEQTRLGSSGRGLDGPALAWAPNGRWLVTAYGGACKDRVGLYRLSTDGRTLPRRLTNHCRIDGTPGPDTVGGTLLFDALYGLGGNDRLEAYDGNYHGDNLYGGAGNDTLTGGEWNNILVGGPGNDRLDGTSRDDTLTGGPGRDILIGGSGKDTIYARDGSGDRVDCGTNAPPNPERPDLAYVDRRDSVVNCERVHRG